jgi:hypothetical protein
MARLFPVAMKNLRQLPLGEFIVFLQRSLSLSHNLCRTSISKTSAITTIAVYVGYGDRNLHSETGKKQ